MVTGMDGKRHSSPSGEISQRPRESTGGLLRTRASLGSGLLRRGRLGDIRFVLQRAAAEIGTQVGADEMREPRNGIFQIGETFLRLTLRVENRARVADRALVDWAFDDSFRTTLEDCLFRQQVLVLRLLDFLDFNFLVLDLFDFNLVFLEFVLFVLEVFQLVLEVLLLMLDLFDVFFLRFDLFDLFSFGGWSG